jgi:hypothetical protein
VTPIVNNSFMNERQPWAIDSHPYPSERTEGMDDANCQILSAHNPYIAGTVVLPSSGQANPTLTMIAPAVHLVRHMHNQEQRANSATGRTRRAQTWQPGPRAESMAGQQA